MDPLTKFPATIQQGDTVKVSSSLDFRADVWTLTYYFVGPSTEANIEAEASGQDFLLTLDTSFTAALGVETLAWAAKVLKDDEVYTVESGTVQVLPDLATSGPLDLRTHAQKTLDSIRAVIENRATTDEQEYKIGTRQLVHMTVSELMQFLAIYEKKVALENRTGQKNILVRFKGQC